MAQYFFESRDDFHYDNSGYYGYIVFNGDEQTLGRLRNALGQGRQSQGLGWYRYGKSFRPANDGRMYDWYIRLHSGGNDKPAAKAVDDFLRSFLQPPAPAPQPPETQKLVQELLQDTLKHYEESVAELRLGLSELKSEFQAGAAAQTDLEERVAAAEEAKEDAEQARAEAEHALSMKQDELEASRTKSPSDQFWHEKYNESEATIQKLKKELKGKSNEAKSLTNELNRLQRDYNDIAGVHADTLDAQDMLAQTLESIKDHDRHISEDLTRLQQNVKHLADRDGPDNGKEGQAELPARFEALEQGLGKRLAELERAVNSGIAAQADLAEMGARLREAADAKETAEQARAEAESELEAKLTELRSLQNESPGDQYWHEKYNDSEEVNRRLNKENKALTKDVNNLNRDLNSTAEDRNYFEKQFLEANRFAGELQKKLDEKPLSDLLVPGIPNKNNMSLARVVDVFLPDVDLVQDSWNNLIKMNIKLREKMLSRLREIVWDPRMTGARRVAGADGWMELREGDWRLYYCRKKNSKTASWHHAVILIGRKTDQDKSDIPWLKSNPERSFFE